MIVILKKRKLVSAKEIKAAGAGQGQLRTSLENTVSV